MEAKRVIRSMFRESLNCLEHIFSQNLDFGDAASEGSKKFRGMLLKTEKRRSLLRKGQKLSNTVICSYVESRKCS